MLTCQIQLGVKLRLDLNWKKIIVMKNSICSSDQNTIPVQGDQSSQLQPPVDLVKPVQNSWSTVTVASYCPGRMVDYPKAKSTEDFNQPGGSPCTTAADRDRYLQSWENFFVCGCENDAGKLRQKW